MTRIALTAIALLGLIVGCRRSAGVLLLPTCTPPAGEFARSFRPATSPDAVLAVQDSGRLLILVTRGDSGHAAIQTIARGSALPSRIPLVVRRLDPQAFLASAPAGSAELFVGGLGYEFHSETLAVRRGFVDTVSYRLKPACIHLQ